MKMIYGRVGVQYERVYTARGPRWRWMLYDRCRLVGSGTSRTRAVARLFAAAAALRYRAGR